MSLPEVMLWQRLRRRAGGLKFRRQHPIGRYVVDFYCAERRLVIEIDGEAHNRADRPSRDEERDRRIGDQGYSIIRVAAGDVLRDADAAAASIVRAAMPLHRPAGGPPPHAMHGEDSYGAA